MTIIYEINPPKIPEGLDESSDEVKKLLEKLQQRVSEISSICDGIHITDSVLGTRRVSALAAAKMIKNKQRTKCKQILLLWPIHAHVL